MDWQALFVILCFFDNHHLVQCHFDHQISHHDHLGIISEFWKYVYSCCCCKLFVLDLIMETPRGNQDYLFWSIDKCIKSTLHVRKNSLKSQYWLDIFPSQASLLVAHLSSLPFLRGPHCSCQPYILRHSLQKLIQFIYRYNMHRGDR